MDEQAADHRMPALGSMNFCLLIGKQLLARHLLISSGSLHAGGRMHRRKQACTIHIAICTHSMQKQPFDYGSITIL